MDWTTRSVPGIRYYSGSAVYRKSFDFSGNAAVPVFLDLGNVKHLARVRGFQRLLGNLPASPRCGKVNANLSIHLMKHIINMSLSALAAGSVWAAEPDIKAVVRADQPGHAIPETLYGIPAYELSLRHVRRGDAAFTARVIFSGCLPAR